MSKIIFSITLFIFVGHLIIPGNAIISSVELTPEDEKLVQTRLEELCGRESLKGAFDCVRDEATKEYKVILGNNGALILVDITPKGMDNKISFTHFVLIVHC